MVVTEYIRSGGPVMIPIILASIVSVTTFFERLWSLRRGRVLPASFAREVLELVRQRRYGDAVAACRKRDVAASRICEVALMHRDKTRPEIKERLEEAGRREIAELERFLTVLATIASIATLLGLLGTTGGMILTFRSLGDSTDMSRLTVGISQALVTTFSGLTVAIPTVVGHRWLLARVDSLTLDLEDLALQVMDSVLEGQTDVARPPQEQSA